MQKKPAHGKETAVHPALRVFHYRPLRSSLLFALIWILTGVGALSLIWRYDYSPRSQEGLTLIITSVLALVLAVHSLEQHGSPYIYLYQDRLKIHYSLLRNVTIYFQELRKINVVNEELELILHSGPSVVLNLGHLSFRDQSALLENLTDQLKQSRSDGI